MSSLLTSCTFIYSGSLVLCVARMTTSGCCVTTSRAVSFLHQQHDSHNGYHQEAYAPGRAANDVPVQICVYFVCESFAQRHAVVLCQQFNVYQFRGNREYGCGLTCYLVNCLARDGTVGRRLGHKCVYPACYVRACMLQAHGTEKQEKLNGQQWQQWDCHKIAEGREFLLAVKDIINGGVKNRDGKNGCCNTPPDIARLLDEGAQDVHTQS